MSDRYKIIHRTKGQVALYTWSIERAKAWLSDFNPRLYADKTLQASDFAVIDTVTGEEIPA